MSFGEIVTGFQADVPGEVEVLVAIEDLEQARRVLADTKNQIPIILIGLRSTLANHYRDRILRIGITITVVVMILGILWPLFGFWSR